MKNIILSTLTLVLILSFSGCGQETSTPKVKTVQKTELREDIRILTVENTQGKITTKSIEKAFKANGF
ncbi:MAG: hypothetical protein U9R39_00090, partial [Campylobacterota bacterium]|nr:hypothetical protein [Campylobacterota bacterium]